MTSAYLSGGGIDFVAEGGDGDSAHAFGVKGQNGLFIAASEFIAHPTFCMNFASRKVQEGADRFMQLLLGPNGSSSSSLFSH